MQRSARGRAVQLTRKTHICMRLKSASLSARSARMALSRPLPLRVIFWRASAELLLLSVTTAAFGCICVSPTVFAAVCSHNEAPHRVWCGCGKTVDNGDNRSATALKTRPDARTGRLPSSQSHIAFEHTHCKHSRHLGLLIQRDAFVKQSAGGKPDAIDNAVHNIHVLWRRVNTRLIRLTDWSCQNRAVTQLPVRPRSHATFNTTTASEGPCREVACVGSCE